MTRRARIIRNTAAGVLGLVILAAIAGIWIVRTGWFRDYVRQRIVTAATQATGGRTEIDSLSIDWSRLRATIDGFVIHGNEPPAAPPFLRIPHAVLDFRFFASLHELVHISFLELDQPELNVTVRADGSSNVPQPPHRSTDRSAGLESLMNLAIGRLELRSGVIRYNSAAQEINAEGNNLHIRLGYHSLRQDYEGSLAFQPLYVTPGNKTPFSLTLNIPLTLKRDQITVQNATIVTPVSRLMLSGSVTNLNRPVFSAQLSGRIALADVNHLADVSLPVASKSNLSEVIVDADAQMSQDTISIRQLHLGLGQSTVEAKGTVEAAGRSGTLEVVSRLNLPQIAQLAKAPEQAAGEADFDGTVKLAGMTLQAAPFRLKIFGGQIQGAASLERFERYRIQGRLSGFALQGVQKDLGRMPLPYSGDVSGTVAAQGDLKALSATEASGALTIAARRGGIPVAGNINASYSGAQDDLRAGNSALRLPHSSIGFNGSLGAGLHVNVTSRDLSELLAAVPSAAGSQAVRLAGGQASVQATISGSLRNPQVAAHVAMTRFEVEDRRFDSLASDLTAAPAHVSFSNGVLRRNRMQAHFAGSAGLRNWTLDPAAPLALTSTVQDGDLADFVALSGRPSNGYAGTVAGNVNLSGTPSDPAGSAEVEIAMGEIAGQPFDQAQARAVFADQMVSLPSAYIRSGAGQIDLTAAYQHARDNLAMGRLTARLNSTSIDLAQIRRLKSKYPGAQGTVQVQAVLDGTAQAIPTFQLTSLSVDASARGVRFQGQDYGDLTAKASTSSNTVNYTLTSDFAGSRIAAGGRTQLTADYPTDLTASLSNLPLDRVLAVARQTGIPARGVLAGSMHFSGTVKAPQGDADLTLTNAVLYDEPADRIQLRARYLPASLEVSQLAVTAGPSRVNLSGRFDHPAGSLREGSVEFQIQPSRIDLARVRRVQQRGSGLAGSVEIQAEGKFSLSAGGARRVTIQDLNGQLAASGIKAQGKDLGNLKLTASTSAQRLNFTLASNLANSSIQARGATELSGDYQTSASLNFNGLSWANLRPLTGGPSSIDGLASGSATVDGPLRRPEQLNAMLRLNQLQIRSTQAPAIRGQAVGIQNQGDIAIAVQDGRLRIDSAHLTGPQTDLAVSGTASLRDKSMNLMLDASTNLALLHTFRPDTIASGSVAFTAAAQGTFSNPSVNGRLELHQASVSDPDFPLGMANANGVIALNGRTATIQNLTADSGGGKVTLAGFVTLDQPQLRFGLRAGARNVRVHLQQGLDVVATASVDVSGGTESSLASGSVTLDRVSYLPQTDIAALLTRSAPPIQGVGESSPLTANMRLDILVRSTSATAVRASAAENVQVISDVRIRGTLAQPGATGSIRLSQGKLAFFGSRYTITTGTISFYDPNAIRPMLNLSLETQAQGVTVSLTVSGPVDDLKLSYTSDPPLQFNEIVALLGAGQTPTSDPTLLANAPPEASQTFQERGESAILGTALANPVSNRLQRVFGVTQLKIDPSFTSGSQLPQARVTLQQQVSPNVTFTYVTDLATANQTEVRVLWSINPQWSAIADRDENGLVSVNLQYKKNFR